MVGVNMLASSQYGWCQFVTLFTVWLASKEYGGGRAAPPHAKPLEYTFIILKAKIRHLRFNICEMLQPILRRKKLLLIKVAFSCQNRLQHWRYTDDDVTIQDGGWSKLKLTLFCEYSWKTFFFWWRGALYRDTCQRFGFLFLLFYFLCLNQEHMLLK